MIKLYCFGESGNAYKVALALTFADMEWQPEFVDFFNGAARTPEFRAINVMGEVPVLVDGDTTLTQSGVMLDYISSKSGKLGGRSAAERREVLRWLLEAAYKVLDDHLTQRKWVAGEAMTVADLSCCGYLFYPEPFGFARKDWPHIDAWLGRISAVPGWKAPYDLMPGSPADRV